MSHPDSLHRAIHEPVTLAAYDPAWPSRFEAERARLADWSDGQLILHHIGSTAVPGMMAKPIIDCIAEVPSLDVADSWVERLCQNGYTTSAAYNEQLGDRRWLMRHADGRRTHHLHLVLAGSARLVECIRFRDALRADASLAAQYVALKVELAGVHGEDREAYTAAKQAFIVGALR